LVIVEKKKKEKKSLVPWCLGGKVFEERKRRKNSRESV